MCQVLFWKLCTDYLLSSYKQPCYYSHLPRLRVTEATTPALEEQTQSACADHGLRLPLRVQQTRDLSQCLCFWPKWFSWTSTLPASVGAAWQMEVSQSPGHTWSRLACLPSGPRTTPPRSGREHYGPRGRRGMDTCCGLTRFWPDCMTPSWTWKQTGLGKEIVLAETWIIWLKW